MPYWDHKKPGFGLAFCGPPGPLFQTQSVSNVQKSMHVRRKKGVKTRPMCIGICTLGAICN